MRPSREEDGPALASIHKEAWIEAHSDPALGLARERIEQICYAGTEEYEESRLQRIRFAQERPDVLLMRTVLLCGQIAGLVEAICEPLLPEEIFFSKIYLAPECRGKGVLDLAEAVLQQWGGRDLCRIALEVGSSNHRAIRAYQKRGYEIIAGSEKVWQGIPSLHMSKDIF